MYHGIASEKMIVRLGQAGLIGFLGTGGWKPERIENAIQTIQKQLTPSQPYGINLLSNLYLPELEEKNIEIYLRYGIKHIEAAGYIQLTSAIVHYRVKGLALDESGKIVPQNTIMAKISRPEVARLFMSPPPQPIVQKLLKDGKITQSQARWSEKIPMADDICVEADSGGHTDQGVAYVLMPAILYLREEMMQKFQYLYKIRVGAAGGIGTPEAAAAAFVLGADFILTGSINQCTVEAGTSDAVKEILQNIQVQDTEYAPAGDMFELGAKVQVVKKGLFFPARANKLYDLYRLHNSLEEIEEKTKEQLQSKYFHKSFEEIWQDVEKYYPEEELRIARINPKRKMALIFRWYFGYATRLAMKGDAEHKVDYQIFCGPSLGAFNQWVQKKPMADWHNRHVDEIAELLMKNTAELLNQRFQKICEKA